MRNDNGRFLHLSIRTKLILSFLIMIIPIFLLGYVSQRLTYNAIENHVTSSTRETIKQSAKLLDMLLKNVKDEYIKILASSQVQDYYNHQIDESDEFSFIVKANLKSKANNYLTNRVFSSSFISNIWIIAGMDNSLGTSMLPLQFDQKLISESDWYKNSAGIKSRLKFWGFHQELDGIGKEISYAMSLNGVVKRISGNSFINKSVGAMIIDIDLEYILNFLTDIDLGERGEVHLICADGRDLSIGSDISGKYFVDQSLVTLIVNANDADVQMVKYRQEKYRMIYKSVRNTDLIIVGLQPEAEIMSAARSINIWTAILIILALGTAIVLGLVISFGIGGRIAEFSYRMRKVARGDLDVSMPTRGRDEIAVLGYGFNSMIADLKQYISESVENEKIKREMEINLLISQINPHFIYNTLNSLIYLARENKNNDIIRMIETFIRILQNSINFGEKGIYATIKQEVESVKNYNLLQQYRYPDKYEISWDIEEELLDSMVPKMILQPLVENALFHGICPVERFGFIRISIKKEELFIKIRVEDNGEGISQERMKEIFRIDNLNKNGSSISSIGLNNIKERVRNLYGTRGNIIIGSNPDNGTRIEISIPINQESFYTQ